MFACWIDQEIEHHLAHPDAAAAAGNPVSLDRQKNRCGIILEPEPAVAVARHVRSAYFEQLLHHHDGRERRGPDGGQPHHRPPQRQGLLPPPGADCRRRGDARRKVSADGLQVFFGCLVLLLVGRRFDQY